MEAVWEPGRARRAGREARGTRVWAQRCCPALLPDAACCPGLLGGAQVRSRNRRNRAPWRAVTLVRPGPLERKPWGSQEHPHRTGEGHAGGTWGKYNMGAPQCEKSQWTISKMGMLGLPSPGTLGPSLRNIQIWRGKVSEGGRDWGILESTSPLPPALSPSPQGLPGPGKSIC